MDRERGYEVTDVRPGPVVLSALVLAGVVSVVSWGMVGVFRGLERRASRLDALEDLGHVRRIELEVPSPRLQDRPSLELEEHRALERRRTEEYAWIDREAGLVRIPVGRAVELLLERGLPARSAPKAAGSEEER